MFIDDYEKIRDMIIMSKDDFLKSYSYLTKKEYDDTYNYIMAKFFPLPNKAMIVPMYHGRPADCIIDNMYYWYCHDPEPVEVIYDKELKRITMRHFVGEDEHGELIYGPDLDKCYWEVL
jgi:hypothetical protein